MGAHTLQHPKLAFGSNRAFFLGERVQQEDFIEPFIYRRLWSDRSRQLNFEKIVEGKKCSQVAFFKRLCPLYGKLRKTWKNYSEPKRVSQAIKSYSWLRNLGFIREDEVFLTQAESQILEKERASKEAVDALIKEYNVNAHFGKSRAFINKLVEVGHWNESEKEKALELVEKAKEGAQTGKVLLGTIENVLGKADMSRGAASTSL